MKGLLANYKILRLFFLSFLLVMALPIAVSVYSYAQVERLVFEELREKHLSLLESASNMMDERFREIDNLHSSLSLNRDLQSMRTLGNPAEQKDSVYSIYRFGEFLTNYGLHNRFIETVYLYFNNSDIVMSPQDTYLDSAFFYDRFFRLEGMDYDQWHEMMRDAAYTKTFYPAGPVYIRGADRPQADRFFCLRSIYPYGEDENGVSMLLLIRESQVLEMLRLRDAGSEAHSAVIDDSGNVLVATDRSLEWERIASMDSGVIEEGGQMMLVFSVQSGYNSWRYLSVLPRQTVVQRVTDIKQLFVGILGISLLLGTAFSFLFAYQYSKPITEAANQLRSFFDGKNTAPVGLNYVKDRTRDLISTQASLNSRIQKQLPMLRTAFVESLLRGDAIAGDIQEMCAQLDIHFAGDNFLVFSIYVESADDSGGALYAAGKGKELARELIAATFDRALLHDDGMSKLALILTPEEECDALFPRLDELIRYLTAVASGQYGISLLFAAGTVVKGTANICHSYFQSQEALEYKVLRPDCSFILFSDLPSGSSGVYLPRELENKLVNLLQQGDHEQAGELVQDIWYQNLRQRSLPPDMLRLFVQALSAMLLKAADNMLPDKAAHLQIQTRVLAVAGLPTADKQRESILQITQDLCEHVQKRRKSGNQALIRQILAYIEEAYANPDISLTFPAQRHSISEVYLSQFFKEQTGVNFSVHLENTRMQAAQELLTATDKTVEQIAGLVGYSSSSVFRNAFKRRNGISPIQYRKNRAK